MLTIEEIINKFSHKSCLPPGRYVCCNGSFIDICKLIDFIIDPEYGISSQLRLETLGVLGLNLDGLSSFLRVYKNCVFAAYVVRFL
mgnify:CR=1 FL=1